jgi:alpha,alpha-trehalose-phosphate synthase [UDP-forming]
MWTRQALEQLIDTKLSGYKFIVVANREPYIHKFHGNDITCMRPASGMATAVDPIMQASGGTWIAHGSGDADKFTVDKHDHVLVPPEDPTYTLRRIWLSKQQEDGFYYKLANEGLWPLCHITFTRPHFDPKAWQIYREVNQIYADAVLEEAKGQPTFVFIHDYHFCLLPRMLKNSGKTNLIVAQFWHIPWPNRETFRTFPWLDELIDGLLGNDLFGFHVRNHCQNFLETVDRSVEAIVDYERFEITRGGRMTTVRPFPISIDFAEHHEMAQSDAVQAAIEKWRRRLRLKNAVLGIGIERLDYTKGIPDRLRGLNHFFELYPDFRGKVQFMQVAVPSRSHLPAYQAVEEETERLVEQINWRWGDRLWTPIVLHKEHYGMVDMIALHQLASFCIVSSLHDGMNLVAKEFVASRYDEEGVLILSKFAGAASEFTDALTVNPFAVHEMAEAIHKALIMPVEEQKRRMSRMRNQVEENNVYRWAGKILSALLKFDFPEHTET